MEVQVGKVYRSRDGRKVEALKETDDDRVLCFYNRSEQDDRQSWGTVNKNGVSSQHIGKSGADLIEEWRELHKEEFYIQESFNDEDFKFGGKEWMNFKPNNWAHYNSRPASISGRVFKITIEEQK